MQKELVHKDLTEVIISAALSVHKSLGPGFSEKIYEKALLKEFKKRNIDFENQKRIKVFYDGEEIGFHILDFLIAGKVIVELKAIDNIENFYLSQLISYLKATKSVIGLMLNFAQPKLQIKRVINSELL